MKSMFPGPTAAVSLCEDMTLNLGDFLYDGLRGLFNISWNINFTTATDTTQI